MSQVRRGFTLIELLVAVGIIAFLGSMTLLVIGDSTNQAREAATAATILKIDRLLAARVESFNRALSGNRLETLANQIQIDTKIVFGLPTPLATNQSRRTFLLNQDAARRIAKKLEFKEAFPQRFLDLPLDVQDSSLVGTVASPNPNGILDIIDRMAADPTLQAAFNISLHQPETESSELLYYMLTRLDVYGTPPVGADQFTAAEVQDTDGDGLPEFIDAWGNPLRFYRWPTRLMDPFYLEPAAGSDPWIRAISPAERAYSSALVNGLPPSTYSLGPEIRDPLTIDPDDSIGTIFADWITYNPDINPNVPAAWDIRPFYNEGLFHTPDVYHTPLIVSMGRDEVLGLFEPFHADYDLNRDGMIDWVNDINGNGSPDPNETEDANGDGVLPDPTATIPELGTLALPLDLTGLSDDLVDNITNRNRRAGGRN